MQAVRRTALARRLRAAHQAGRPILLIVEVAVLVPVVVILVWTAIAPGAVSLAATAIVPCVAAGILVGTAWMFLPEEERKT